MQQNSAFEPQVSDSPPKRSGPEAERFTAFNVPGFLPNPPVPTKALVPYIVGTWGVRVCWNVEVRAFLPVGVLLLATCIERKAYPRRNLGFRGLGFRV